MKNTPEERLVLLAQRRVEQLNNAMRSAASEVEDLTITLREWKNDDVRVSGLYKVGPVLGEAYRRATEERLEVAIERLEAIAAVKL